MATKRLKRSRDPIALAKLIGDIATGQTHDQEADTRDQRAVGLGRKGGEARAAALDPEKRREIGEKIKKHLLLAILVSALTGTATAQTLSPKEIFYSDEVLKEAKHDVTKMDVDELRLFADFLAQCTNILSQDEVIQNACDIARARYAIEYASERALDQLLSSINVVGMAIRSKEKLGKSLDEDMFVRFSNVTRALRDTTNLVFRYTLHPIREPN